MASAHDEAVVKWGSAFLGDLASTAGLGAALGIQWSGSGLAFTIEATAEIAEIGALGVFGIVGGGIVAAALPVVAVGLAAALLTNDEKTSRDLVAGAEALPFTSAGTLLSVAVSAPFLAFSAGNGGGDPLLGAKVAGPLLDLGAGLFDPDATQVERALAGLAAEPGAADWYADAGKFFTQIYASATGQSGAGGTTPGGGTPTANRSPGGSAGAFGGGAAPGFGPGYGMDFGSLGIDEPSSLMPGMGDVGGGASGAPFTMNMSISVPVDGSSGASSDGSNPDAPVVEQPSDCAGDCEQQTAPVVAPPPPTDCAHDCSHDCSDCSDCSDCECDC